MPFVVAALTLELPCLTRAVENERNTLSYPITWSEDYGLPVPECSETSGETTPLPSEGPEGISGIPWVDGDGGDQAG